MTQLIELRVSGDGKTIEQQTDRIIKALEAAGFELVKRSQPYPNRNSGDKRVYLSFVKKE
jgi:pyruvate/2-oxoacid:ferredoxin oxidoreductase beta subunit